MVNPTVCRPTWANCWTTPRGPTWRLWWKEGPFTRTVVSWCADVSDLDHWTNVLNFFWELTFSSFFFLSLHRWPIGKNVGGTHARKHTAWNYLARPTVRCLYGIVGVFVHGPGKVIVLHQCIALFFFFLSWLELLFSSFLKPGTSHLLVLTWTLFSSFLKNQVQAISQKTVKVEFALDLLSVADQFLVEKLKMLCENSIQKSIDVDNVAHMLSTADQRQAHGLRKKCFEYILRHFGKVIGTQAFSEISKPLLQEVLFAASKRGVHLRWRWSGGVRVGWRIVNKIYVKSMWWVPSFIKCVDLYFACSTRSYDGTFYFLM